MTRRVVVTGVGLISSVGIGTRVSWDALLSGTCGIGRITHFDASAHAVRIAGEVKEFDINIPDDAAEKIQTVGQAIKFIEEAQNS